MPAASLHSGAVVLIVGFTELHTLLDKKAAIMSALDGHSSDRCRVCMQTEAELAGTELPAPPSAKQKASPKPSRKATPAADGTEAK